MKFKTIGIIGGMGPEASAELYLRIIQIFQEEFNAKFDADFPEIILVNLPIPDVVEELSEEKKVEEMLVDAAKRVETAGADFIVIPCNTVNYFLPKMQDAVSIPILSTLGETANQVLTSDAKTIGIIGTAMTIQKNIYGQWLSNISSIVPTESEQERITEVIMNILAGKKIEKDKIFLTEIIGKMKEQGAKKIILGCTDLPLLIKGPDLVSSLEALARACVRETIR